MGQGFGPGPKFAGPGKGTAAARAGALVAGAAPKLRVAPHVVANRVGACAGARPIHRAVALVPRTFGRELLAGTCEPRNRPLLRKLRAVARALGVSGWMAAS